MSKDKAQRLMCGCAASVDIGMYNTCRSGCRYCYANYNMNAAGGNFSKHNPLSPMMSGEVGDGDKISVREAKSCRDAQVRFFV